MEIIRDRYSYNKKNKRRPKRQIKVIPLIVFFIFIISLSTYSYFAITMPTPALAVEVKDFSYKGVESELDWPSVGSAAIGSLDEGLYDIKGSDDTVKPIASMSKIITALAVLDKEPLSLGDSGDIYTITATDVATYNSYVSVFGSVMPVRTGQNLTQYQLLQGVLLPSGNNAADYLVNWVFGSMEGYVAYANTYLKNSGIDNTSVADASGFSPNTVSTPSDMIKIGQLALKNEVIAEIVSQESTNIPDTGVIRNTNQLLQKENVIGLKTGTTDEAGRCLLFAIKHGPDLSETLVGVVMGQPSMTELYASVSRLSDSALANYSNIELVPARASVANYEASWGQTSNVITNEALTTYGWKGKDYSAEIKINDSIYVKATEVSGEVSVVGKEDSIKVFSEDSINEPSILWRLLNFPTYW